MQLDVAMIQWILGLPVPLEPNPGVGDTSKEPRREFLKLAASLLGENLPESDVASMDDDIAVRGVVHTASPAGETWGLGDPQEPILCEPGGMFQALFVRPVRRFSCA
jgi:hypothetical protein